MGKYIYVTETVSPEKQERRARTRRTRDGVSDLPQGFTFKANGRQGFIYYREGAKVLELYLEMSGVPEFDILLNVFGLKRWVLPKPEDVSEADVARVRRELHEWLEKVHYPSSDQRNAVLSCE